MYEKPPYQRLLDAERQEIVNHGHIYIGPSDSVLKRCGIPLEKKKFIERERNQILFGGGSYEGPSRELLGNISEMDDEKFKTMFTAPNVSQRFIDRARNEALMHGKPDPYPLSKPVAALAPKPPVAKPKPVDPNVDPSISALNPPGVRGPTVNKDKKYAWDRWWDQDFNLWYNSGCASDDLMPGDHPNPNHEWNTNRQAMIERLIGNDGEESY